jgi:hypothetical protein
MFFSDIETSPLWFYLSQSQQRLLQVGMFLVEDRKKHPTDELWDYSYLVFPFAKSYEGFLKQLFLDLDIISTRDYASDHFRIGKALSPHFMNRFGYPSAYTKIKLRYGIELADMLWLAWKEGRNTVFHYFPHNIKALSEYEAMLCIHKIIDAMQQALNETHIHVKKNHTNS